MNVIIFLLKELILRCEMMNQERIIHYEKIFDRASDVAERLEDVLKEYDTIQDALKEMENYYTSPEWKEDYEADEQGLIPSDLKRGVLSQDGVYNLLELYKELSKRFKDR